MNSLLPFLVFFIGAVLVAVTGGTLRKLLLVATPIVGAINLWLMDPATVISVQLVGLELVLFEADRLSMLFGWLFHLASFIAAIYALHTDDRLQHVSALAYAGCALGAVYAGDLLTLFLFWEG